MKSKVLGALQSFSRAAVGPVKFMAVMGMFLAAAVILQLEFFPAGVNAAGNLIKTMMDAMLNNLAIVFCIGIACGLAKKKKAEAAILALVVFLIFLAANNAWLTLTEALAEAGEMGLFGTGQAVVLGFQVVDMNVILGMILGALTGFIHNRFSEKEFIDIFRIYGGTRFSFILMIPITLILAILLCYIWPVINSGIGALSNMINNTGVAGIFVYAFGNRFLIPTGLHHMLWMPFCFTPIGGTAEIGGQMVSGAANIFYAEMGLGSALTAIDPSLRFATFGFAKIFGSLGIALAFMKMASPAKKKEVRGMILPSAFVGIVAGITEPLDFSFLFISPLLWLVHSLLAAVSEVLLWVLGSRTFMLYGLLDTIISNSVIPPSLSKFWIALLVGAVMTVVWYFVFCFLIKKLNIKTPGREEATAGDSEEAPALNGDEAGHTMVSPGNVALIIEGLGGADNIAAVTNCFTRLRCEVKDPAKVDQAGLEKAEQKGIVVKDKNVQVIIGMKVEEVKESVCAKLGME